jgi:AcrR family transcriptional regulator
VTPVMRQGAVKGPPSGRRQRLASDEVKRRMLDAARDEIDDWGGLAVSLERLNLEEVIQRARVPRTSVYRVWERKEDFLTDVLCDLAGPSRHGTAAFSGDTLRLVRDTYAEHLDMLSTPEQRRLLVAELCRVGVEQNFQDISNSPEWRNYLTLTVTALSYPDAEARAQIIGKLLEAEQVFIGRMGRFYETMGFAIGFRMKPGATYEQLAAAGAAVVEGLAMRQFINPEMVHSSVTRPALGGDAEWTIAAAAFHGIIDSLIELVGNWTPPDIDELASRFTNILEEFEF